MSINCFSLWRRLRKAHRDERGAIAVEFALITPVLIFLFGGIVEGSLLFHAWGNMEHVGRQAARSAAIGELDKSQAESLIVSRMQQSTGAPTVTAVVEFLKGTSVGNEVVVNVTMPASELSKLLPFGIFRTVALSTTIRMHWEMG